MRRLSIPGMRPRGGGAGAAADGAEAAAVRRAGGALRAAGAGARRARDAGRPARLLGHGVHAGRSHEASIVAYRVIITIFRFKCYRYLAKTTNPICNLAWNSKWKLAGHSSIIGKAGKH